MKINVKWFVRRLNLRGEVVNFWLGAKKSSQIVRRFFSLKKKVEMTLPGAYQSTEMKFSSVSDYGMVGMFVDLHQADCTWANPALFFSPPELH